MRWINCGTGELPDTYDQNERHYKLDGHRSNGSLIEAKDGGVVFEFRNIGGFGIIEDLSRIEWLCEDEPADQEALWLEAKEIIMRHYDNHNYPLQAVRELENNYTITKK